MTIRSKIIILVKKKSEPKWKLKIYILGSLTEVEFSFSDQTGAYGSCSTVINGKSIILGGDNDHSFKNQISLVKDCRLTRIGSLPFTFNFGACNTFQNSDGISRALLCFGYDGRSNCHRFLKCLKYYFPNWVFSFDGTSVISTVSSNYDHYGTSLGSIQNVPIALGGYAPNNKHVESLQGGSWRIMGDFPFVKDYISLYSFVTFHGDLYLFGKI